MDAYTGDMELGEAIRTLRQARGVSLWALSQASGIHMTTLQRIEKGRTTRPTWDTISAIAAGLGIPLDDLRSRNPAA